MGLGGGCDFVCFALSWCLVLHGAREPMLCVTYLETSMPKSAIPRAKNLAVGVHTFGVDHS